MILHDDGDRYIQIRPGSNGDTIQIRVDLKTAVNLAIDFQTGAFRDGDVSKEIAKEILEQVRNLNHQKELGRYRNTEVRNTPIERTTPTSWKRRAK